MAYIDREKLIRDLIDNKNFYPALVKCAIENAPTEDVVPRSEVEQLENELAKCYIELDKSTDFYCSFIKSKIQECPIQDEVDKAKQEAIEEFRQTVNSKIKKYNLFGKEYIQRIMQEVQKEMVGEKDV